MRERRRSAGSGASLNKSSSVDSRPEAGPDFHDRGGVVFDDRALSPVTALGMSPRYDQWLGAHREVRMGCSKRPEKRPKTATGCLAFEAIDNRCHCFGVDHRLDLINPRSFASISTEPAVAAGQDLAKKQSPAPTPPLAVSSVR